MLPLPLHYLTYLSKWSDQDLSEPPENLSGQTVGVVTAVRGLGLGLCLFLPGLEVVLEAGQKAVPLLLDATLVDGQAGHEEGRLEEVDGGHADGAVQAEGPQRWQGLKKFDRC